MLVIVFHIPRRDVTDQTLPDRGLLHYMYSIPDRESLDSDIPAGDGKTITFFTVYGKGTHRTHVCIH
jgi:hypothetical protein